MLSGITERRLIRSGGDQECQERWWRPSKDWLKAESKLTFVAFLQNLEGESATGVTLPLVHMQRLWRCFRPLATGQWSGSAAWSPLPQQRQEEDGTKEACWAERTLRPFQCLVTLRANTCSFSPLSPFTHSRKIWGEAQNANKTIWGVQNRQQQPFSDGCGEVERCRI